jgi:short-subunit dehydrogenase
VEVTFVTIILMSSNTAKEFVVPKHSIYSGSKGAIESFIPVLALDCGKKKINVNGVAPVKSWVRDEDDISVEEESVSRNIYECGNTSKTI